MSQSHSDQSIRQWIAEERLAIQMGLTDAKRAELEKKEEDAKPSA